MQVTKEMKTLKFDYKPKDVKPLVQKAVEDYKKALKSIYEVKGKRNFENTLSKIVKAEYDYETAIGPISFLSGVTPDQDVKKALEDSSPILEEMHQSLIMDRNLYQALVQFREDSKQSGEWDKLTHEDRLYTDDNIKGYKESGINLSVEG